MHSSGNTHGKHAGSSSNGRGDRAEEVPVTAYDGQPEDDGDTFVDHGDGAASTSGGAAAGSKPGTKPFSLEGYYASMNAAVGGRAGAAPTATATSSQGVTSSAAAGTGAGNGTIAGPSSSQPRTSTAGAAASGRAAAGSSSSPARPSTGPAANGGVYRSQPSQQSAPTGSGRGKSNGSPHHLSSAGTGTGTGRGNVVLEPSRLVSEFQAGKKKLRDMALSPDGSRLFAAFGDDPVSEMELDGTSLKHARSVHGTEQVYCMAVVRMPSVSATTFTNVDATGSAPRARKSRKKKKRSSSRKSGGDFSSDAEDNDLDSLYGFGGGPHTSTPGKGTSTANAKESYMLWCGVNRGNIEIIDLQGYNRLEPIINAHKQTVNKIWYLENGRVWSAGRDKGLVVWDPLTRRPVKKRNIAAILTDLCYVSQMRQVWAIADDYFIRVYDAGGEDVMVPNQPRTKTKNLLVMKADLTLVKYNEDVNVVWAGTVKNTAIMDPENYRELQTLRLILSSVCFHYRTAIITGHGKALGTDRDCVAVLDVSSPLQPSLLFFSGARMDNVMPNMGMRLFRKAPLGVVAYMAGERNADCNLGVFVYEEMHAPAKANGLPANRNSALSKQRTEFLGHRNIVASQPAPPQRTTPPEAASLSNAAGGATNGAPAPARYGPSVSSVYPYRPVTSYVSQQQQAGVVGAAVSSAGRSYVGGPTTSTAGLAPVSLGVLQPPAPAAPSPEIQASLAKLDQKMDDVRAVISSASRSEVPQSDFAKLCIELSRWMGDSRGNAVKLPESETARIQREYASPEGKAAATAVAMLRCIAEEGFSPELAAAAAAQGSVTPDAAALVSRAGSAQPGSPSPLHQAADPSAQEVGGVTAARRTPRMSVYTGTTANAGVPAALVSVGSPRPSLVDTSERSPRMALVYTPRSTWGQGALAASPSLMGDGSEGPANTSAEAVLLGMVQAERRQLEALQRQNHRIQSKSEALANGFNVAAQAIVSLSEQVSLTAKDCTRALTREGAPAGEVRSLEEQTTQLRASLDALHALPTQMAVSTELSTKAVKRTTNALVACAEDARGVVSSVSTTVAFLQSPSPLATTLGLMGGGSPHQRVHGDRSRSSGSSEEDGVAAELDRTGSHQTVSSNTRRPAIQSGGDGPFPHTQHDVDSPLRGEAGDVAVHGAPVTGAACATEGSGPQRGAQSVVSVPAGITAPDGVASPLGQALDPASAKCYTVTVSSPRALLDLLKSSVNEVETFVARTNTDWDEKLTMYRLFVFAPYDGPGKAPVLAKDFIQCLSVWDLWLAERMRLACREELYVSLIEVLLECRRREGNCVRAIDGEFLLENTGSGTYASLSRAASVSQVGLAATGTVSEFLGSGSGTLLTPPHSSSLPNSQRAAVSAGSALFDGTAASSTLSSSPANTVTNNNTGSEEDNLQHPLYFIYGDELSEERKRVSESVVMTSLQLEALVSRMRVSLTQLLSSIPEGVKANPVAHGFASLLRRWEETSHAAAAADGVKASGAPSTSAATRTADGNNASSQETAAAGVNGDATAAAVAKGDGVPRAPVRVFADKLRGSLYWSHLTVNFIAMSMVAVLGLLYRFDGDSSEGSYVKNENFLYVNQKLADWVFVLREEGANGAALSALLGAFNRFWMDLTRRRAGGSSNVTSGAATPCSGGKPSYAFISYEQGRSIYLLHSYLNIAMSRFQHDRSIDKAVELFFSSFATAEDAHKAVGGSGEPDKNPVGAIAAADVAADARAGAEASAAAATFLSSATFDEVDGAAGNPNNSHGDIFGGTSQVPSGGSGSANHVGHQNTVGNGGSGQDPSSTSRDAASAEASKAGLLAMRVQALADSGALLQRKTEALLTVAAHVQNRMEELGSQEPSAAAATTETQGGTSRGSSSSSHNDPAAPQAEHPLQPRLSASDEVDSDGGSVAIPLLERTSTEAHTTVDGKKELFGVEWIEARSTTGQRVWVPQIQLESFHTGF